MKSHAVALCGVLTALAVMLLCVGGLIPASAFSAPMLAMLALLPVLEEYGPKAAATAYAAAAILALLLAANREAALVFLFFGWYPVLQPKLNALHSKFLRVLLKLAICNASILLLYGVLWKALGLPEEASSTLLNALMLLWGNALFLLTDLVIHRMCILWRLKLRRHFFH